MRRRTWLAGALLSNLVTASFLLAQPPIDESAIGRIRNLGGFISLDEEGVPCNASLKEFPVSEFGLLSKLRGIRSLDVRRSKLGDREIGAICDIGTLQSLVIADGRFTHDGLRDFARLEHLSALNIDNSSIVRVEGQEAFGCFSDELVALRMRGCTFGDDLLQAIAASKTIRSLELAQCGMTDRRLAILKPMTQLRGLILSEDAGLTDQSLDTLTYLPNLRTLYISKNSLSDDGEFTLKMALPKCLIIRSK